MWLMRLAGEAALVEQARRRAFFAPAFERLVGIVRQRVRFPAQSSKWNKEQMADFRKTRYEVGSRQALGHTSPASPRTYA